GSGVAVKHSPPGREGRRVTDFLPGVCAPLTLTFFPFCARPGFPDASGTVGTAYQCRAHGTLPESAGGSHDAVAYGVPFRRRKYAVRKSGSPVVNPPGTLPAPGYRSRMNSALRRCRGSE